MVLIDNNILKVECLTGGKSQFGDKLKVLKGRTVTAFPDIDGYDHWRTKLAEVKDIDIRISNLLEERATPQQREAHIDIADILISELASIHCPTQGLCPPFGQPRFPPDYRVSIAREFRPCNYADGRIGPCIDSGPSTGFESCPTG